MSAAAPLQSDARRFIVVIGITRWVGNVLLRFPYILLTPLAVGLGVPTPTATALLGIRELGGLSSPVIGAIADRGHERRVMLTLGVVGGLSCLAIALAPPLWLFTVLLLLGGTAKFGYDTAQSAWIGHHVPFERRGATFGVVESGWPFAFLLGGPVCAWLTVEFGWRAPFLAVGCATLLGAAVVAVLVGPDTIDESAPRVGFRAIVRWRPPAGTRGMYAYAALQPFCQMIVFAVAGEWFVRDLHMSLAGVGWNTMFIGSAELVGTTATIWTSDRWGKRRCAVGGLVLVIPAAAMLGLVGSSAVAGVALVCLIAIGLEYSFVSALPIFSEVDPEARAAAMGAMMAVATLARAISSTIAGWLFVHAGIGTIGLIAAVLAATAIAVLGAVELH